MANQAQTPAPVETAVLDDVDFPANTDAATFEGELARLVEKWFPSDENEGGDRTTDENCIIAEALIRAAYYYVFQHSMDRRYYAETGLVLEPGDQDFFFQVGEVWRTTRGDSFANRGASSEEELTEGLLWILRAAGADARTIGAMVGSDDWTSRMSGV